MLDGYKDWLTKRLAIYKKEIETARRNLSFSKLRWWEAKAEATHEALVAFNIELQREVDYNASYAEKKLGS